jgi:hypothetical protein
MDRERGKLKVDLERFGGVGARKCEENKSR